MRRSLTTSLALASLLVTVACEKDNTPIKTTSGGATQTSPAADSAASRGHSLVRVVNAADDGKNVAVQLGELTLFRELTPGSVTDYTEVETNLARFSVLAAGSPSGTMLAQEDQILLDGGRYTVFIITQDMSQNALRVVRDDPIPDSGKARLRLVHAAPGAPQLDVRFVGAADDLFSGVNFKSNAGYADVHPAVVALEIRPKGESRVLLRIADVDLRRSTSTTIVVTGTTTLRSFKFTDALMVRTPRAD